jgi:hypothetical protein
MDKLNIGGSDKDWETYELIRQLELDQSKIYDTIDIDIDYKKRKELSRKYNILEKSKKHLIDSNMSYWYHFRHSISNGNKLLFYAVSSYVHALVPGKLKQHAARGIISMYEDMKRWPHLIRAMYEISRKKKKII